MFLSPQQYYVLSGIRPRKRFGQHFLAQPKAAERIVEAADLQRSDVVVEIGPGLGALTEFIIPKVERLHLVEIDKDLAGYLNTSLPSSLESTVVVHEQDVLNFDFKLLSERENQELVVIGNLPYNISSPLVFRLLESRDVVKRAIFMLQKEVGERLAASPEQKAYGVLSVMLGAYGKVSQLFRIGPSQFFPAPKVDSIVIRIEFNRDSTMVERLSFKLFRRIVNTAFQQRRKTLRNSLKALALDPPSLLDEVFAESGIDPRRRPETLTPAEFVTLAKTFEVYV